MEYLIKVEDESQKRDHVAFRRISDLENGGLSRRGKGSDGDPMSQAREAGEKYEENQDDKFDGIFDSIFENETARAKAKKSKKRKKSKRKKKKTKRKKR